MGNPLGAFSAGMHGRITTLKAANEAHIAATTGIHGAVAAATANKLMIRDGSGRVNVIAPAASDSSSLVPTTAWVQGELSAGGFGTVTSITAGVGMTGGVITGAGTIALANTPVTPGSFVLASITVDQQGRITAASSGVSAVTAVTGTAPINSTGGSTPIISMPAATGSVNGYMLAGDKSKLDNIAAGAQVNTVSSVFGRTGAVVKNANDYNITDIDGVTVSTAAPSGGANGDLWFQF